MKDIHVSFLADYYGSMLNDKALQILRWYYDDDLSLGEISEKLSITRQGVQDYLKKTVALLIEYEDKLGIKEKTDIFKREINYNIELLKTNANYIAEVIKNLNELKERL